MSRAYRRRHPQKFERSKVSQTNFVTGGNGGSGEGTEFTILCFLCYLLFIPIRRIRTMPMSKHFFIACFWTAAISFVSMHSGAAERPNVLLLMSDDLAATLGCYGYPNAKTP